VIAGDCEVEVSHSPSCLTPGHHFCADIGDSGRQTGSKSPPIFASRDTP
jgi:hypothetical protein